MKQIIILLLFNFGLNSLYAQPEKYNYPIDSITGKITFEKKKAANYSQSELFEFGLQFVATQNFDRQVEIRTKNKKAYYNTVVVPKAITYQDKQQGKIFGNGFFDFEYRGKERFVITFSYKIYVKDKEYRYVFTDFVVKEFVDAGKSIGKGHINSTSNHNSDARILSFPLEEFMERSKYADSDPIFSNNIKELKSQLARAMKGEL